MRYLLLIISLAVMNAAASSEYPIGFRVRISSDVAKKYAGAESQDVVIDPRALFVGDSITAGWRATFVAGVRNNGVSGANSAVIADNARRLIAQSPRYVHILAGTNDFRQGIDPAQTIANINSVVLLAKSKNIPIIVGTVLPWSSSLYPDTAPKILPFNNQLVATVKPNGAFIADYYKAMVLPSGQQNAALFQADGIHPNDAGYVVMNQVLRSTKREMYQTIYTTEQRAAWREKHGKK